MKNWVIFLLMVIVLIAVNRGNQFKHTLNECKSLYKRTVVIHECEIVEGASRMVFSLSDNGTPTGVSCTMISPMDVIVKNPQSLNIDVEVR